MQRPFAIEVAGVQPLRGTYQKCGYDVVARSAGSFECSPLWCNWYSEQVPVNRWCLLDDAEIAFQLAARVSRATSGAEPGPYYVVEVWKRGDDAGGPS